MVVSLSAELVAPAVRERVAGAALVVAGALAIFAIHAIHAIHASHVAYASCAALWPLSWKSWELRGDEL